MISLAKVETAVVWPGVCCFRSLQEEGYGFEGQWFETKSFGKCIAREMLRRRDSGVLRPKINQFANSKIAPRFFFKCRREASTRRKR